MGKPGRRTFIQRITGQLQNDGRTRGARSTAAEQGQADAAAGILAALAERHQAQEQLAGDLLVGLVLLLEQLVGAARQRAQHSAAGLVGCQSEHAALALLEQPGERILQQRQRPRFFPHSRNHRRQ